MSTKDTSPADRGETIAADLTPSWVGVLHLYLEAYQTGSPIARGAAHSELIRMARLADLYVSSTKVTP